MADSDDKRVAATGLRPGERPTLKTIARLTGLAVATVSRALSDAPDIGDDTKRRVREVARELGYRPNRAGVRLRTGKTNVISLVLSTDHDMMNHTARLISSIAAALRETPYHLIVTPYFATEDPMVPVRYIVETASADGIILNQTMPEDPRIAYLMKRNFPFATHGRTNWSATHPYFDFDNCAFGKLAIEALAGRGRRDVLLVMPPLDQNYAINMRDGFESRAAELGVRLHVLALATSDSPSAAIERAILERLQVHPGHDGVVCASTTAAMSAAAAFEAAGRVLGQDVDLVAKEAIPFLKRFRPPILTIHEDVARAGEFLARATIQRIAKPKAAPMQGLDVPSTLI